MLRATLKSLLSRKLRLLLSGLAVILGVMFVAGSFVLTDTIGRSFDQIFSDVYAYTDVQVHAEPKVAVSEFEGEPVPGILPDETVATVAQLPGVAAATGLVEVDGARVIAADGSVVGSFGPPRLGISWLGETELTQLREGRGPTADHEIAVNASLAEAAGVTIGDQVGVLTLEPRQDFVLVGIFGYAGGRDTIGGAQEVAFTDRVAQELMLGEPDVWTAIDVRAAEGFSPEQVRDTVAAALGEGYQVRTGEQLADEFSDGFKAGLAFFNYILLGFAAVALFVGVFLILNTFSIIVAQRTRELALTRAMGASRGQVIGSVMIEAVVIGLLASVIGLAAGIGVGALLASLAAGFVSIPMAGLAVPASAVIAAIVVGLLVTVLAATLPAIRASRIPPIAALQEAATPDRPLTRLSIAGAVVFAAGAALLAVGLTGAGGLWTILGGVLVSFIGVALLTPLLARPMVAVLGRLFSWSVPGKLGRLNSGRNPRRTAITAAALMVGVALVSGVGVILTSAKSSLGTLAEEALTADLVISGEPIGPRPSTFDPAVLSQLTQLPEVTSAAGLYQDLALVDGERTYLTASNDLAALRDTVGLVVAEGRLDTLAANEVVLDLPQAEALGLRVGDQIEVQLSRGELTTYRLVGLYEQTPLYQSFILPEQATANFGIPHPTRGFVQLADGAAVDVVQPMVAAMLVDSPEVSVINQRSYIDQQVGQFDFILTMIQVLLALAILIAVLGVINTLALSVLERTRELGLLRAVGLGRAATMRMVTVEAVVISLFGALLGIVVGIGMGAAVVRALRDEGITTLALPWQDLIVYLILAGLVGVVAAVLPSIRAARTNVLQAIAYD